MSNTVTDPATFPHAFDAAMNGGDLDSLVQLYDEQAAIRVQSGDTHHGSDAVRGEVAKLMAAKADITNTLRHLFHSGDTALIIVDYVLRLTTPGGPVEVKGTATNVLRRHPDRGWRLLIANPQGTA